MAYGKTTNTVTTVLARLQNRFFMKIIRTISQLIVVFIFVCSCKQEHGNGNQASAIIPRFKPGQVWTFHTPPNEITNAELTVARVDIDSKEGPIIYVSVTGVQHIALEATNMVYPFSEDALNRSVVALVRTNAPLTGKDLEGFQEVYELMRQDIEAGKSDKCFKITVAEVLEARRKAKQ